MSPMFQSVEGEHQCSFCAAPAVRVTVIDTPEGWPNTGSPPPIKSKRSRLYACQRCLDLVTTRQLDELKRIAIAHHKTVPGDPQNIPMTLAAILDGEDEPLRCDFCSLTDVRWRYPASTRVEPDPALLAVWDRGIFDGSDWAACLECHRLIDDEDWDGLVARSLASEGTLPVVQDKPELVRRLLDYFRACRSGAAARVLRPKGPRVKTTSTGAIRAEYAQAIDTRLRWLRWLRTSEGREMFGDLVVKGKAVGRMDAVMVRPLYDENLARGELFVMVPEFCRLVDQAQDGVPEDLAFEAEWLHTKSGFLWLAEPFPVGRLALVPEEIAQYPDVMIRAIGWGPVPEGAMIANKRVRIAAPPNTYHLMMYAESPGFVGFLPWSYPVVYDKVTVGDRIKEFELDARMTNEHYAEMQERIPSAKHELFWFYTAAHLMAQRLATTVRYQPDRATRRRIERAGQTPPPFVQVITLRRLEAARPKDHEPQAVDWQWQWAVTGHWRRQFYATEGVHKRIFIESYIKGPPDKPLKSAGVKLYVAAR